MKKSIYLFALLINISFGFSQEHNRRTYSINVNNKPQTVELIENENGKYSGNIIT